MLILFEKKNQLEVMLDEMEQVKRFLYDVKDAYETDRHEWAIAKEEFRNQLELKENLWIDCSMRLNEIVNVVSSKNKWIRVGLNVKLNKDFLVRFLI